MLIGIVWACIRILKPSVEDYEHYTYSRIEANQYKRPFPYREYF